MLKFFYKREEPSEEELSKCPTEGPRFRLLTGNALTVLGQLPAKSVQCVVTSPPYWRLRDYQVEHQLGLEETPEAYVAALVEVFQEIWRVLRDDGTVWLNLGDSYACSPPGNKTKGVSAKSTLHGVDSEVYRETLAQSVQTKLSTLAPGLKPKDLSMIPAQVALALRADGWYLRSDIVWNKPNPMPDSVTDRPTHSHEFIFLLAKRERYFYDADAIREPFASSTVYDVRFGNERLQAKRRRRNYGGRIDGATMSPGAPLGDPLGAGRNKRSVWTVTVGSYPEAHFATFTTELIEPCVKAGTSAYGACSVCGAPWRRVREKGEILLEQQQACGGNDQGEYHGQATKDYASAKAQNPSDVKRRILAGMRESKTVRWEPTCSHQAEVQPCLVLDPFCGTGTVGEAALGYGQAFIGIDLDPKSIRLAAHRISAYSYEEIKKKVGGKV